MTITNTITISTITTPRKYAFLPCGHLGFGSAVTAQNEEFKGSFHSSYSRLLTPKLNQDTQYLASILSDRFVECNCRNISCALGQWSSHSRRTFISTFAVTRPWWRTLTNGSGVKYVFPRCALSPSTTITITVITSGYHVTQCVSLAVTIYWSCWPKLRQPVYLTRIYVFACFCGNPPSVLHIRKLSPDQQENVTFPESDASGKDSEAFVKLPPGTFGSESWYFSKLSSTF